MISRTKNKQAKNKTSQWQEKTSIDNDHSIYIYIYILTPFQNDRNNVLELVEHGHLMSWGSIFWCVG
jgi:hypothetical protein